MPGALILPDEDADPAQVWDDATALLLAEQCDWSQFPAREVAIAGARTLASFGDTGRPELLALAISLLEDAHDRAESLPVSAQAETALCLGEALREGSLAFDEPDWLPEAIAAGEQAVLLVSEAWALVALCETYRAAFRATGITDHLTGALRCARTAVVLASPADMASLSSNLGAVATHAAARLDDPRLLDEACEAATTAVRRARSRDPYLPVFLANLALTQNAIAERDASVAIARRAVRSATRAVQKEPASLNALLASAQCLETLARLTLSDATFHEAADRLRRAEAEARGTPRQPEIALERSRLDQQRFEHTGDLDLLTEATRHAQRAVALQGGQAAATAHALLNLAVCRTRACEHGLTGRRTRATQLVPIALDRASPAERLELVGDAGLVWLSHYEQTGAGTSLRTAIELLREATRSPHNPPQTWSNLAGALLALFDKAPSEALIDEATDAAQHACAATTRVSEGRIVFEAVLASCLETSFRTSGDPAELRHAADYARRAVRRLDPSSPDATAIRTNCAVALRTSYEHNGRISDLTLAAQLLRDAVPGSTPSNLPTCLSQLAATLRTRFEAAGDPADLRQALAAAIQLESCGVAITMAGAATISACWLTAYESSGDRKQLEAAVQWARTSLIRRTRTFDARAAALTTLANALLSRFEVAGEEHDLKEALLRNRQAIRATQPGSPLAAGRYANLANVLRVRASLGLGRTTTALRAAEAAVRLAGTNDRHLAAYLSGVALVLSELGRHSEASHVLRQAVKACPSASPDRHFYRTNLAASLRDEFTARGSRRVLAEAIRILCRLPPSRAPWALLAQTILGDCLHARGATGDREAALMCWTLVRDDEKAPSWLRLIAATSAAETAAEGIPDWGRAAGFYRRAVELHVQAAWHGLAWASRRRYLAARPNMGADAAAAALQVETDGGSAVTLLEAGRDIMWRGRADRRNTIGTHPMVVRLYRIADQLDALDQKAQALAAPRFP